MSTRDVRTILFIAHLCRSSLVAPRDCHKVTITLDQGIHGSRQEDARQTCIQTGYYYLGESVVGGHIKPGTNLTGDTLLSLSVEFMARNGALLWDCVLTSGGWGCGK